MAFGKFSNMTPPLPPAKPPELKKDAPKAAAPKAKTGCAAVTKKFGNSGMCAP